MPTAEFQREQYAKRPWVHEILTQTRDPALAWANWMARDSAFAQVVIDAVRQNGLPLIEVDGTMSISAEVEQIVAQFRL